MRGKDQPIINTIVRFCFVLLKHLTQTFDVCLFKRVLAVLPLSLKADLTVRRMLVPFNVNKAVDVLQRHDDALDTVRDLDRNRVQCFPASLLEVSKLSDLLTIQPHFPSQSPSSQRGLFPVILHKTDVVSCWIDP